MISWYFHKNNYNLTNLSNWAVNVIPTYTQSQKEAEITEIGKIIRDFI